MTWLSERKIESLTRKRRPSAQIRVLREAGTHTRPESQERHRDREAGRGRAGAIGAFQFADDR